MAYRVVVDKPRHIRALASSAKIVVADAKLEKTQVVISSASYAASISSRVLNAFAAYTKPVTQIHYQNLTAIDMALDPFSLNKYFRLEAFNVDDLATVSVEKRPVDTVGTSDQVQSFQLGKGIADNLRIGDFAYILLDIRRNFDEVIAYSDAQTLVVGLNKSESFGFYDATTRIFGKSATDTAVLTEAAAVSFSISFSDSA